MSSTARLEKDLRLFLEKFPVYKPQDELYVVNRERYISIGYNVNKFNHRPSPRPVGAIASFSLQLEGPLCYILSFNIRSDFWQKGLGTKLYQCVAAFCAENDVKKFETTPSGMGVHFWPKMAENTPIPLIFPSWFVKESLILV